MRSQFVKSSQNKKLSDGNNTIEFLLEKIYPGICFQKNLCQFLFPFHYLHISDGNFGFEFQHFIIFLARLKASRKVWQTSLYFNFSCWVLALFNKDSMAMLSFLVCPKPIIKGNKKKNKKVFHL